MHIENKQTFSLFANCIIVKGANRSLICDLYKNRYDFIPNALYYILKNYKNKTIKEIKDKFEKKNVKYINQYFKFLVDKEYVFFATKNEKKMFPQLNLKFHSPSKITNCIIDVNKLSNHNFIKIKEELKELGTSFAEIRVFNSLSFHKLKKILQSFNSAEITTHLLTSYNKTLTTENIKYLLNSYNLNALSIYGFPPENKTDANSQIYNLYLYNEEIKSELCCGKINPSYFAPNIETFSESQNFNSCLNQKIGIDIHGEIKNCPSMCKSYGNLKKTSLKQAILKPEFKTAWKITKDKISICQDCEFRHICTDCRAYLENPKDQYSKPLKCGYDPYTNEWHEWSTNPLKQKAIDFYGMREILNIP